MRVDVSMLCIAALAFRSWCVYNHHLQAQRRKLRMAQDHHALRSLTNIFRGWKSIVVGYKQAVKGANVILKRFQLM